MKINIDMEKYNVLSEKATQVEQSIRKQKDELDCALKEIKKLFPKGYWWAFDIDPNWKSQRNIASKKF